MNDYVESKKGSLEFWLSFFLMLGAVLGSLFCNRMDGQMKGELHALEGSMLSNAVLLKMNFGELFFKVASRRFSQLFFVILVVMTPAARTVSLFLSGYLGFSAAVMVCALTMDAGLMGIVQYLSLMFPQAIFYMTIYYVVFWWMPREQKRLTLAAGTLLMALAAAGAGAESFINPWIAVLFLGK